MPLPARGETMPTNSAIAMSNPVTDNRFGVPLVRYPLYSLDRPGGLDMSNLPLKLIDELERDPKQLFCWRCYQWPEKILVRLGDPIPSKQFQLKGHCYLRPCGDTPPGLGTTGELVLLSMMLLASVTGLLGRVFHLWRAGREDPERSRWWHLWARFMAVPSTPENRLRRWGRG
jgi:hypothetical protein